VLNKTARKKGGRAVKTKASMRAHSREPSEPLDAELSHAQQKVKNKQRVIRRLRKNEQQFRSLLDDLPVGLYRRTPGEEGRFVTANRTIAKLLGYQSVEQFVGLKAADLYLDISDLRKFWQRLLTEEQVRGMELRLKKQDGTPIWGAFTARLVRNDVGEAEYVDGVMEDITERKKAEQESRESERRLASLIDLMPDAAFVINENGVVVAWNRATEALTGVKAEDILGKGNYEYAIPFYGERRPILIDLVGKSREELERDYVGLDCSGDVLIGEAMLQVRGKATYLQGRARAFKDLRGEYIGAIEILHDFTELKRIEQALRDSEQKVRRILETTGEGFWMIDNDAITVAVNDAMCSTLARPREQIVGHSIFDFVDEENVATFRQQMKLRAGGEGGVYEIFLSRPDDSLIPCIFHATPLFDEAGTKTGAFALVTDITELREAKEAAEAASRAKSTFLANMSHEIRTPMNAILGFTQLLQRDVSLAPKQRESLDAIGRSGEHLLALINDILELSKIEAGRTILHPVIFNLPDLIDDIATMFSLRTKEKDLLLSVEKAPNLPRVICADVGKLRQVLINLLGNAVKFTQRGGIVLRATASDRSSGNFRLAIEVKDTGPGIASEDLAKVFEYFEQAGGSAADRGTGLGLAISREFVRLMGGDIQISSELNKGSVFRFEIEARELVDEQPKPPSCSRLPIGLQPGQDNFRILLVDDKEENLHFLRELLETVGFATREATNGLEAITVFNEWEPHLILMDVRMPVMSGYEAIRRIKAMRKGQGVPILAVSASVLDDSKEKARETGADGFIAKPYRHDELFEKIAAWLHVRYVYAEERAAGAADRNQDADQCLAAASVSKLPREMIENMRKAATGGYQDRLLTMINEIAAEDEPVARRLRELAVGFEYEKIAELLKGGD
jgi:PAS domain S-box-containing protein